jgi:hypothetical protein
VTTPRKTIKRTRRIVAFFVAGLAALGGAFASAASLGTITENTLGANTTVIASCDTDGVALSYTNTYDPTVGKYKVTSVTVSAINAACASKKLDITLKNATNVSVGSGAVASLGAGGTIAIPITGNVDANPVVGAAVVIFG